MPKNNNIFTVRSLVDSLNTLLIQGKIKGGDLITARVEGIVVYKRITSVSIAARLIVDAPAPENDSQNG